VAHTQPEIAPAATEPHGDLFVRNATGLVRGVPSKSSVIINFIPGHPTQTLAAVFFFALTLAPGGNVYLGILLVLPMTLAFSYAFGLLTSMIPRSGGDYVLVSRVVHPVAGLMSSFSITMAGLLSNAFFGLAFVTVGLGPGLTGIGLIAHNHTLVNWGNTISSSHGWQFAFGAAMMIVAGLILTGGWRRILRVQATLFWMVTGSLIICGLRRAVHLARHVHPQLQQLRPPLHALRGHVQRSDRECQEGRRQHSSRVLVRQHDPGHRHPRHHRHLQLLDDLRGR